MGATDGAQDRQAAVHPRSHAPPCHTQHPSYLHIYLHHLISTISSPPHLSSPPQVVHRHRDVAQISGALGPRPRIRGFLRARLRLPPDASLASADLLWQQAYLCLRSGLYQDAIDILRENEV